MIGRLTQPAARMEFRAVLAGLALLGIACAAAAYPRPAAVATRWELQFQPGELRLYTDILEDESYWYFTYTVTNRTGGEQTWAPSFVLFTDAGEVLHSGIGVSSRVTNDIIAMLGNELLENQYEIIGEIHQGREHQKDGLVIWPARSFDVTEMSLFIGGISGETARVTNPVTGEPILLRKTLQRDYLVPGNALARGSKPVELVEQRWVFR